MLTPSAQKNGLARATLQKLAAWLTGTRADAQDQGGGDAGWSQECLDFRAHWEGLRVGPAIPTSRAFLDVASPRFAGYVYLLELGAGAPIVRLQGTALELAWSRNLTGGDFFPGRSPRFREAGMANLNAVVTHPCGHLARSTLATAKGRKIKSDWIFLPLAVDQGRAPRIVGAMFQQGGFDAFDDVGIHHFELHKLAWMDVGSGVPTTAPAALVD